MLFETKEDINLEDLKEMDPALLILLTRTFLFCSEFNLPCRITSIKSDRKNIKSSSKTHEQGRAIDISTKGWTEHLIHSFLYRMNRDYAEIAAISASDLKPRAAIYHDVGYGSHIHLQVRPNAKWHSFIKE